MDKIEQTKKITFLLTKVFSELVIIFGAVSFGFMIAIDNFSNMWKVIFFVFFAVVGKTWAEYHLSIK